MRLLTSLTRFTRAWLDDRRGNVAMILALCGLPLVMMGGFAVDLVRQQAVKQDAQVSIDHAALAAAISRAKTEESLREVVGEYLAANLDNRYLGNRYTFEVDYDDRSQITVRLAGEIDAFFASLIGRPTMPINVDVTAIRGAADAVELVLVLDNTNSMTLSDGSGQTRISALKTAATDLVNTVKENEDADVKIGVVPYGEYVNVGKDKQGSLWLIADNYVQDVAAKNHGKYPDKEKYCAEYGPEYETTVYDQKDGYKVERKVKKRDCVRQAERAHPKAGQDNITAAYKIYWNFQGCVYSRPGAHRLTDAGALATPYHGVIERNRFNPSEGRTEEPDCMTPILPLTASRASTIAALNGMRTDYRNYANSLIAPQTYIPAGLLWGINVLSPDAPFTEARPYASGNRNPRKILVLMTDGENTMRFKENGSKTFGVHERTDAAGQLKQTNDDVTALCNYAKTNDIEIYTVALGVADTESQNMLRGCATEPEFFFNAADNAALGDAFRDIAASINKVRLIR